MDWQTCTDRSQNQTGTNRGQWGLSARVNTPTRKCESKPQPFPVPQSRLSGWSLTSQSPMVLPRSDNPPLPPLRFSSHQHQPFLLRAMPCLLQSMEWKGCWVWVSPWGNREALPNLKIVLLPSTATPGVSSTHTLTLTYRNQERLPPGPSPPLLPTVTPPPRKQGAGYLSRKR